MCVCVCENRERSEVFNLGGESVCKKETRRRYKTSVFKRSKREHQGSILVQGGGSFLCFDRTERDKNEEDIT